MFEKKTTVMDQNYLLNSNQVASVFRIVYV